MIALDEEGIRKARITQFLIFLNIIFFISVYAFSQDDEYFLFFAQINRNVIERFEIWRIFTSMFLHQTWFHLITNMIMLYLYGSLIEKYYKSYEYVLIYILSGIMGNLFSLILYPLNTITVGASGGIFGLIGAAFMLARRNNSNVVLILGLLYIIYFLVAGIQPSINTWAHFFGLLGGIIISFTLAKYNDKVKLYEDEDKTKQV